MAALLQLEENVAPLPDVWEVVYKAALALAKAAAVDEMLGNVSASLQSYAKVQYSRTEMIRHTTAHQLSIPSSRVRDKSSANSKAKHQHFLWQTMTQGLSTSDEKSHKAA